MYSLRETIAFLLSSCLWMQAAQGHDSKHPNIPSCSTTVTKLEPQLFPELNSERHKIAYGPFAVPSRDHHNGMQEYVCIPPHPCGDCMILSMQAGLEYLDGSDAVPENGMMLHHAVFENRHRPDPMCKDKRHERFFASGDERTFIDLTFAGSNRYGYPLGESEMQLLIIELMNMKVESEEVMLTVTWEFIPTIPSSFKAVQPYWFDIGACGSSDKPAMDDAVFNYTSPRVKAPTSGVIATAVSHLHNGGTHLELLKEGSPLCTSQAYYAHGHIHEMTSCNDLRYAKGDEFWIAAHYNTTKHAPMKHGDGGLEPVMGISLVYAVEDKAPHGHGKRSHVLVGFLCAAGILLLAGVLYILWNRRRSNDTMPIWLRKQYKNYKSVFGARGLRDASTYEPLIDHEINEDDQ